jgi:hypothetical protein
VHFMLRIYGQKAQFCYVIPVLDIFWTHFIYIWTYGFVIYTYIYVMKWFIQCLFNVMLFNEVDANSTQNLLVSQLRN